jgi:hypothetical protein
MRGEGTMSGHEQQASENKSQAWCRILTLIYEEASKEGQHFLAYLIGLAVAHLKTTDIKTG